MITPCKNKLRIAKLLRKYALGNLTKGESHELFLRNRKCRRKPWLVELYKILSTKS